MRVALDGSFLRLPPSGTGTYVRELAAAMLALDPALDLALLNPERWADAAGGGASRSRRLAWDLVGVAAAARRKRAELLHVPHFSAPLRTGVPLVVTIHDAIPLLLPEYRATRGARLRLAVARRTVRAARLVLTPSRAAAADIERALGIPAARLRVTPEAAGAGFRPASDPADPATAAVARRFGVRERYVFNVGGMDVRKGLPLLVEAFARALPRLNAPAQLVIAGAPHTGNPTVFPPLAPVIARLGLGQHVVLTGFVSANAKLALYQRAALYATPSRHEGFGLTVLEAMACGVPVVAANRTSLPEVVGDAGLLVEPEVEAVAAAMVAVLNGPDLAQSLRTRGLARAAEFSWERTARLTLDAYAEALAMS